MRILQPFLPPLSRNAWPIYRWRLAYPPPACHIAEYHRCGMSRHMFLPLNSSTTVTLTIWILVANDMAQRQALHKCQPKNACHIRRRWCPCLGRYPDRRQHLFPNYGRSRGVLEWVLRCFGIHLVQQTDKILSRFFGQTPRPTQGWQRSQHRVVAVLTVITTVPKLRKLLGADKHTLQSWVVLRSLR